MNSKNRENEIDQKKLDKLKMAEKLIKIDGDKDDIEEILGEVKEYIVSNTNISGNVENDVLKRVRNCENLLGIKQSDVSKIRIEIMETRKSVIEAIEMLKKNRDESDELIKRLEEKMENLGENKG